MRKISKFVIIISILFFFNGILLAAPAIESTTGSLVYGSTLLISGQGFGSKPIAKPFKWDDFESGVVGQKIGSSSNLGLNTSVWNEHGIDPVYSNVVLRPNSTRSVYHDLASSSAYGYDTTNYTGIYYVTFWHYYTQNMNNCSGFNNFKIFRHYTSDAGDGLVITDQCQSSQRTLFFSNTIDQCKSSFTRATYNSWHRYELYYSTGTNNRNGFLYFWIDGQLQGSCTNLNISAGLAQMRIGHYQDVGLNLDSYTDDVYIDTTQSRVEIGNASTWSACTHREIQIPIEWSNSSIKINVNKGSIKDGDCAFLYVVDANGNANSNGYKISGGAACAGDTAPPSAPSGLHITN